MLKLSCTNISSILASLYNRSIKLAAYPTAGKIGFITPVHKRGNMHDFNNYRPISILPIISRVFERLNFQLKDFLEENSILSSQQHGFRLGRSCQTALLSLTSRLFNNRDKGLISVVAALDYSKAFDSLNHNILISRLRSCRLSNSCVSWFKSYLYGGLQRVRYNQVLSEALSVVTGVPEGSVFGPLLYNIYINNLLCTLPEESCVAYADDITLIGKGKTIDEARAHLQTLLDIVSSWSQANSLALNTKKCNVMFISASRKGKQATVPPPSVFINGQALNNVENIRILGVTITSKLDWTEHGQSVCAKMNGRLCVLRRLGHVLNMRSRLQLFNAFIKPHLQYCLPVWGNCSVALQHAFDKTLIRCVRYILADSNIHDLNRRILDCTHIFKFTQFVTMANVITVFNILHSPKNIDYFVCTLLTDLSQRTSRSVEANKIVVPVFKHKSDDLCFLIHGQKAWNALPNKITAIQHYPTFMCALIDWIKSL
jgi:hypothetical protein